ncbi:MAG: hypothetical protein MJE68_03650 [Proteobacteria bacterium]|nr:hypothetical protein [Pseudomonadota bacterium]
MASEQKQDIVDDREVVEVGEESLMILQPIKKKEDHDFMKLSDGTVNESLKEKLVKRLEEVKITDDENKFTEMLKMIAEIERKLTVSY